MQRYTKTYRLMLACALVWVVVAPRVFAATIILESEPRPSGADGSVSVDAYLNTEGESVNGIEGVIVFPEEVVRVQEVRAGNSSVALWIEAPRPKASAIPFTGIIPGGVSGRKIFLFSVIFNRQSPGVALLEANLMKALKNDGEGSMLPVRKTSISIGASPVSPKNFGATLLGASVIQALEGDGVDNELPDIFPVAFGRDDGLFDGKYFAAFVAQDKGSGVSYYEVHEDGYAPARATSPYLLKNQKLDKKILVTAFDGSGNARTVAAYPPEWQPWYRRYGLAAIVLGCLVLFLIKKRRT